MKVWSLFVLLGLIVIHFNGCSGGFQAESLSSLNENSGQLQVPPPSTLPSAHYFGIPAPMHLPLGSAPTAFDQVIDQGQRLPRVVSAGQVIRIAGEYDRYTEIEFQCTKDEPCWLVGAPGHTISSELIVSGSYYILDGLNFKLNEDVYGSSLSLSGEYGVLQNSQVSGSKTNGGIGISGDNIVVRNSRIFENGDVDANFDQDRHGIKVMGSNIWVLDNEISYNSGDGVQIGDIGSLEQVHHIYVGNNRLHHNKQTGVWVKEARHVVISGNLSYAHRPSDSSDGEGMGGQYDFQHVWFLQNLVEDNSGGIGFKSSNNGGGGPLYVLGNSIKNVTSTSCRSNVWGQGAISSWNGAEIFVLNNHLETSECGVVLNGNTGAARIEGNNFSQVSTELKLGDPSDRVPLDLDPYQRFFEFYGLSIEP